MSNFLYKLIIIIFFLNLTTYIQSQDYWQQLNGPFGGDVMSLQMSTAGNLYALRNEAVYISTNNSESWDKLPNVLANTNLCMDVSPTGVIYAGKSSGGIWWTSDNGQNWDFNPVHIAPHSGLWASVLVAKANSMGHIYINSFMSMNGGNTFNSISIGNPERLPADYAFNGNVTYAATNNGVYYSDNNGAGWTSLNGNPPSLNITSLLFNNNTLTAATNGNGIYKTTDNGSSWQPLNDGITDFNVKKVYRDSQNNYFAGTYNGNVFKSTNEGALWTQIYSSETGNEINSIVSHDGAVYLSTKKYGVLKSSDGLSWFEKNRNLFLTGNLSMAFQNSGEIFVSGMHGINSSSDNGLTWKKRNNGLPSKIIYSMFTLPDQTLLAGVHNAGVYRSTDNGLSWIPSANGISGGSIKIIKSSPQGFLFAVHKPGNFVDTLEVYRSSDNGLNWTKVFQPLTTGMGHFAMDGAGNLFAGGFNEFFETAIVYSTDNGNNWSQIITEEFFNISNLTAAGNKIYTSSGSNILYSTDFGNEWNLVQNGNWTTSGFSEITVNALGHIFAAIGSDIYVTANTGASWSQINSGFSGDAFISEFIFNNAGFIYGLTYYDGIFKSTQSTLTEIAGNNFTPEKFSLSQNYPNPFNPSTVIKYEIGSAAFVKVKVYDVLGNEVASLVNENKQAGSYNVSFDGSNFASGVYFYKLQTVNFTQTKKFILTK